MAAIPKDLPDLPPLLDQAILDPLLNDEQLHELFVVQQGIELSLIHI